ENPESALYLATIMLLLHREGYSELFVRLGGLAVSRTVRIGQACCPALADAHHTAGSAEILIGLAWPARKCSE
ncbi:hypothetical protein LUZ16_29555, partial [Streptomyces albireticuli]|uniref:hypothetical protein n=1 Tax=Streptomyces albireticuli TaxID=1940 RepID=UPI001E399F20